MAAEKDNTLLQSVIDNKAAEKGSTLSQSVKKKGI